MGHRKGHSLGYGGMVQQHVVHFLRDNFFSTTVDGFLNTTGDEEVTSSIHIPLATRPEPALGEGILVGRSVVVALHNACSTYHDLPSGTHRQYIPGLIEKGHLGAHSHSDRTSLARTRRQRIARDHGGFCHTVGFNHRDIEQALQGLAHLLRLMPMARNACTTSSTCRHNRPYVRGARPEASMAGASGMRSACSTSRAWIHKRWGGSSAVV